MALLAYFKGVDIKKQIKANSVLPKPNTSLSQIMSKSTIEAVCQSVDIFLGRWPTVLVPLLSTLTDRQVMEIPSLMHTFQLFA